MIALRYFFVLFCCIVQPSTEIDEVRLPPSIIEETGKNGIFRDDITYTMKCKAIGSPPPEYRWLRNGAPLDFNKENLHRKEDGTFEINPTTSLDEGFYRCIAANQYGTVISNTTHLQRAVLSDSVKRKIIVHALIGKPFHLQVTPPRCFPEPEFSWEIGREVDNSPRRVEVDYRIQISDSGDLHFGFIKQSDATDTGYYYKLIVYNAYRDVKTVSSYIQLVVSPGSNPTAEPVPSAPTVGFTSATPTVAVVGRNVTLRCFFNGNPSPHIQWLRSDRKPLPVNRHEVRNYQTELSIEQVEFSDEGPYTCKTKNDFGEEEATLYINVEAAPTFQRDADRPRNMNITEGQTVNISCITVGEPEPTTAWIRNGEVLRPGNLPEKFSLSHNNKSLTIRSLYRGRSDDDKSDLQVIQCNSSNKHGYALGTGYINVVLKDETTEYEVQTVTETQIFTESDGRSAENLETAGNCETIHSIVLLIFGALLVFLTTATVWLLWKSCRRRQRPSTTTTERMIKSEHQYQMVSDRDQAYAHEAHLTEPSSQPRTTQT